MGKQVKIISRGDDYRIKSITFKDEWVKTFYYPQYRVKFLWWYVWKYWQIPPNDGDGIWQRLYTHDIDRAIVLINKRQELIIQAEALL